LLGLKVVAIECESGLVGRTFEEIRVGLEEVLEVVGAEEGLEVEFGFEGGAVEVEGEFAGLALRFVGPGGGRTST